MSESERREATLAGGCFWCIEAAVEELEGVREVTSGYTGGHTEDPSYEEVCSETTGHAEAVRVVFDPAVLSYRELLEAFVAVHDPTTKNREGPDVGSQYRSAVYYHDEDQRETIEALIEEFEGEVYDGIVTEVEPVGEFYEAEQHHQNYYEKHPDQPYCRAQIPPKLEKVREMFGAKTKARE